MCKIELNFLSSISDLMSNTNAMPGLLPHRFMANSAWLLGASLSTLDGLPDIFIDLPAPSVTFGIRL